MTATASAGRAGVNAVIGDDSWIARFGVVPDGGADEDARLRVHLAYVEEVLRGRAPRGLSEAERAARAHSLDLLRAYVERGEFPRNREVTGRRPHFIDEDGRICAVGYLIEQTAGRAAAAAINAEHEWDYVPAIRGIEVHAAALGLGVEELAMIQPTYGREPPRVEPPPVPRRPPPPPPPPRDEGAIQRRAIIAALSAAQLDVERCAERFERWTDALEVRVTTTGRRGGPIVFVSRIGSSRGFQRCVQNELDATLAARGLRSHRVVPMTVAYTFTIDGATRRDDGDGFARPPPR